MGGGGGSGGPVICNPEQVDVAFAQDLGGFVSTYDLTLSVGAAVGDVIVAYQVASDEGSLSFEFPEDDGGNYAQSGADLTNVNDRVDLTPNLVGGGFVIQMWAWTVTTPLAPGDQIHLGYVSGPAISFNAAYVFRGVAVSTASHFIDYHVQVDDTTWHDVGNDCSQLFTTPDNAGIIVSVAVMNTPYTSYVGDPIMWADAAYSTLNTLDSDPADNDAYGFDSMKGAIGWRTIPAGGSYEVGGSFSIPADSYRGGLAVHLTCVGEPAPPASKGATPGVFFLCGEEIVNNARTEDYLRAGLGNETIAKYEIGDGCDCSVLYRLTGEPVTFTSPADDPAPWYDAADPDSTSFLGFLLDPQDLQGLDSTVSRAVYERAGGIQGAATGPQKLLGRKLSLKLTLVADDCCGLAYGMRWLTDTLAASNCDGCAECTAQIRVCCPPEDGSDDNDGLWIAYDVSLIDGPHPDYSAGIEPDCCDMRQVTLTLLAGNPYFYEPAVACVAPTAIPGLDVGSSCIPFDEWFCSGNPSDTICCTINPPHIGTLGAIITISAPSGADAIEVASFADCPPVDSDWDDDTGTWRTKLTVSNLEAGSSLIIDSARHQIFYIAPDGSILDGTDRLELPPDRAFRWIEVADCDAAHCVCVRGARLCGYASGDVTIGVETQHRVLAVAPV
jgi:hypothetical protein